MSAAIDIDNATEPSEGDVVTFDQVPPEVRTARATCIAAGFFPITAAEYQRLSALETDNRHLAAVGRAYQETAVARAERIDELEKALALAAGVDAETWDEIAGLLERGRRAHAERRLGVAYLSDARGTHPELAARLPEVLDA
jgi:hypothetical protein